MPFLVIFVNYNKADGIFKLLHSNSSTQPHFEKNLGELFEYFDLAWHHVTCTFITSAHCTVLYVLCCFGPHMIRPILGSNDGRWSKL
jgi:hypothetical protein